MNELGLLINLNITIENCLHQFMDEFDSMETYFVVGDGIKEGRYIIRMGDGSRDGMWRHQGILRHHRINVVDQLLVKLNNEKSITVSVRLKHNA